MFRPAYVCGLASLITAGCATPSEPPDRCTAQVAAITPDSPILAVGDSLVLVAGYVGAVECRPDVPATELHWASSDTLVATADSLAGLVAARRVGQVFITVHAPTSTSVLGGEIVRVTEP